MGLEKENVGLQLVLLSCPIGHSEFLYHFWQKLIAFSWVLFLYCNVTMGQNTTENKQLEAFLLEDPDQIVLDGQLNEEFWSNALGVSDFNMTVPIEGGDPTEKTIVKIVYDENNLYMGIKMLDGAPSEIKSFQKSRDADLSTDDKFTWILDTFQDYRNAYYFEINPAGAMVDGILTIGQGTSLNTNWDGIWRVWTHTGSFGWSAEIRIPFRSLNFDKKKGIWGINFQRIIRRKNEELMWSGFRRNQGILRPQNAGQLTNLRNISQGLGLELIPYTAVRNSGIRDLDTDNYTENWKYDIGFDVNYNVTPSLKASFTYNTDFAEAEVDDRQINLSRFPLFFPEKRAFFLEGSNIYSFAPRSGQRPYFSRTIGLFDNQPIPITYGARLYGRAGNYDIAFQHVRTDETEEIKPEQFTVARVRKNFWKESRIGIIYTRRSTKDGDELDIPLQDRHTVGVDLELNTSEFLGDKNLQFEAFMVAHNRPSQADDSTQFWDRTSRGLRFNFPNQPWSGHVSYREFGEAFDPAMGFQPRVNFRRVQPTIQFNPLYEKSKLIRDMEYGIWFMHLMDLEWNKLSQDFRPEYQLTFETGDRFEIGVTHNYERLTSDFDILRDSSIIIPADEYTVWILGLELATASWRKIVAEFALETGGFWTGTRDQYDFGITLRPLSGINLSAQYVLTQVDLPEGSFDTQLIRFRGSFDFSPFISLNTNVQYDNLTDLIGLNSRFRWIITPGTEVFLVYNHNWIDNLDRFITLDQTAIMKVVYTHRF